MKSGTKGGTLKISLAGRSGVGKSSLCSRLIHGSLVEDEEEFGCSMQSTRMVVSGREYRVLLFEWKGEHTPELFYQKKDAVLVCFDVGKRESFEAVDEIVEAAQSAEENSLVVLCGLKTDSHRQVSKHAAMLYAESHNLPYVENSAKTGDNVAQSMAQVVQAIPKTE